MIEGPWNPTKRWLGTIFSLILSFAIHWRIRRTRGGSPDRYQGCGCPRTILPGKGSSCATNYHKLEEQSYLQGLKGSVRDPRILLVLVKV